MPVRHQVASHEANCNDPASALREIVFGLHWAPPNRAIPGQPADLDALCVLFGASGEVTEVVCPGQPRSVDGCVLHTGDSRTGASEWDDERIFVFLDALAPPVSKLAFVVVSATGKTFEKVTGACCHVSDRISEIPRVRLELTALHGQSAHTVAILTRDAAGWRLATDVQVEEGLFAELRRIVLTAK